MPSLSLLGSRKGQIRDGLRADGSQRAMKPHTWNGAGTAPAQEPSLARTRGPQVTAEADPRLQRLPEPGGVLRIPARAAPPAPGSLRLPRQWSTGAAPAPPQ